MEKKSEMECRCIMKEETSRVKSISFHPCKKVLIAGLHSGVVQAWNYTYRAKIFELSKHDGPVRVVVFHHLVEKFISGGDDCLIRLWDYKRRSVESVFKGHTDYIRSLEFHRHLPWIISSSDDQSVRIWNFQSRKQIACLTGHTHYVMCARFINESLFASVSLDQTIRVWDYSALVTKSQATVMDMLGVPEVVVKHIVDGHDRGINCVAAKPDSAMFATGGDDSSIRIWDAGSSSVFETDTLHGHHSHVSSLYFGKNNRLISNSEDGTMKIWDTKKRKAVHTVNIESRFWCVAMDREEKVIAAGYDTGFVVYSMEKEAPVYAVDSGRVWVKRGADIVKIHEGKETRECEAQKGLVSLKASKDAVVLNYATSFVLRGKEVVKGSGNGVLFRDSVFSTTGNEIVERDAEGREKRTVEKDAERLFAVREGLLGSRNNLLFWVEGEGALRNASVSLPEPCRDLIEFEERYVAVTEKHLVVLDTFLAQVAVVEEVVGVNSAIAKYGTVFYTTPMHIKFAFPNGECSALSSVEEALWVVGAEISEKNSASGCEGDLVFLSLNKEGALVKLEVEGIEWRFKRALFENDRKEVQRCIESESLIGESSLAYLIRKGFYEEALGYIEDPEVKVELYLGLKRYRSAYECGIETQNEEIINRIGEAALEGDAEIAEKCFNETRNITSLILLYIATNRPDKIEKLVFESADSVYTAVASISVGNNEKLCELISLRDAKIAPRVVGAESSIETESENTAMAVGREEQETEASSVERPETAMHGKEIGAGDGNRKNQRERAEERAKSSVRAEKELPERLKGLNEEALEKYLGERVRKYSEGGAGREEVAEEWRDAMGCVTEGKNSKAANKIIGIMHQTVKEIANSEKNKEKAEEGRRREETLRKCSMYLQGIFAEQIRKKTDSDKVAISCAVFLASLDLEREHREKALRSAVAVCYKKGSKNLASEMSKELVDKYECTDERMRTLAGMKKSGADAHAIDTGLPFCVDVGEYREDAKQCGICGAWSTAEKKTCTCCSVANL